MKRFMVFVLVALTAFGCVSCAGKQQAVETQTVETTPWTIEGAFCDDAENPRYLLDIEYKKAGDEYEKDGYYGYFIAGDTFYNAAYEEADGDLKGVFVSYDDDYMEDSRMEATLKEENGNIRMITDSGEEYLLVPGDFDDDEESLKFYQFRKIYAGKENNGLLAAVYNYLSFLKMGDDDYTKVTIPYVRIIKTDESDPDDILVYGDYYMFDFEKQEDTLVAVSGSHCPGIVHLKKFSEEAVLDYEGRSMDEALTDEDAKELFGDYYEEYVAVTSDRELFEKEYAQIIADYVRYNSVAVTEYSLTDGEVKPLPLD